MARILFLPIFLIILAAVVLLALRVKSMFALSNSKDIILSRPSPFGGDITDLTGATLKSLNSLDQVEYHHDIRVNYRKITAFSKAGPDSGHFKVTGKAAVEFTRENGDILIKAGGPASSSLPRENRWVDFWCCLAPLEESLRLFYEDGMKVSAGNTGSYMQRNYTEIIILSHAMSSLSNQAFGLYAPHMAKVFGKNLSMPGVNIRNFMMRVLVNNLTFLPDYIETKFNVFSDSEFVCDYLQNSRLLY